MRFLCMCRNNAEIQHIVCLYEGSMVGICKTFVKHSLINYI